MKKILLMVYSINLGLAVQSMITVEDPSLRIAYFVAVCGWTCALFTI